MSLYLIKAYDVDLTGFCEVIEYDIETHDGKLIKGGFACKQEAQTFLIKLESEALTKGDGK